MIAKYLTKFGNNEAIDAESFKIKLIYATGNKKFTAYRENFIDRVMVWTLILAVFTVNLTLEIQTMHQGHDKPLVHRQ